MTDRASVERLSKGWKLKEFSPGEGLALGVHEPDYPDSTWLDVPVPGDVHTVLIAAGRIPDPFYDQNERACAWMEDCEWWYRLSLAAPNPAGTPPDAGERVMLVFEGLDTFATIYLNGEEIGRHQNMLRPASFDVTERLRCTKSNVLALRFDPPLQRVADKPLSTWGRNRERSAMRKAQFGYGWDWGPRLPTIGLWRPVELKHQCRAALLGVGFSTLEIAPNRSRAAVAVRVEAEQFAGNGAYTARVRLEGPDAGPAIESTILLGSGPILDGTLYLTVDQPRLWWTHELGESPLYELSVSLLHGEKVLDQRGQRVGLRTLELDQSPDPDERGSRFFRFVLNGVPIFAKGACWIPCSSFVGAIQPAQYTGLLERARAANMTMLRVWGGGIYEDDHFYDECDRLGIMVWQDFMFACAMYPEEDSDFIVEVDKEARYQVRRLRSHPSLAIWCGNNENQWLHDMHYWNLTELPAYGALYYDKLLPAAVADLDGITPYWPGSPFGGNDHNSREEGDVHNWEVWHGMFPRRFGDPQRRETTPETVSFLRYAEDTGRFISEFGMHAAPVLETLKRVIPPEQLYHHSPAMDWHNKDDPKNKGDDLMLGTTGLPGNLGEYITFSQVAQAEGLKFGIEHFRRRKPHCSGTLVWQLNDCWPVLSWSLLDYNGFGKAGYHYVRRAYAPVLASFKAGPYGDVELWVTNDMLREVRDTALVRVASFSGQVLWEATRDVHIESGASSPVWDWRLEDIPRGPDRYLSVRSVNGNFAYNRHFFVPIKDLERQVAAPEMTVASTTPNETRVQIRAPSDAYVYFAHVSGLRESSRFKLTHD
jgi:beta-mannosidase